LDDIWVVGVWSLEFGVECVCINDILKTKKVC